MEVISKLSQEYDENVQSVPVDLLLSQPLPASWSAMEKGSLEAMLKLGNFLLTGWLALQDDCHPPETQPFRSGATAHNREMHE